MMHLGLNGVNIMKLLNMKNVFFIPFGQDDPFKKPNSLISDFTLMVPAAAAALQKEQLQPLINNSQ